MKKISIIIAIIIANVIGILLGIIITLKNIEIDGMEEVAERIITIKIFNQYIDYEYKP